MRRIALVLTLLLATLVPGSVAAASERCSMAISPSAGSPTDVYRIAVVGVPVDPQGGSIEVRIDVRRLGSRDRSIIFAFLIPGVTEFYVDYNQSFEGEPLNPLVPGRYPRQRLNAPYQRRLPRSRPVHRRIARDLAARWMRPASGAGLISLRRTSSVARCHGTPRRLPTACQPADATVLRNAGIDESVRAALMVG